MKVKISELVDGAYWLILETEGIVQTFIIEDILINGNKIPIKDLIKFVSPDYSELKNR
jgi:hypothetical protein